MPDLLTMNHCLVQLCIQTKQCVMKARSTRDFVYRWFPNLAICPSVFVFVGPVNVFVLYLCFHSNPLFVIDLFVLLTLSHVLSVPQIECMVASEIMQRYRKLQFEKGEEEEPLCSLCFLQPISHKKTTDR